jgi:hypothetical protein
MNPIRDLCCEELSVAPPATPRFSMPLELGPTITWSKVDPKRPTWFLWESTPRRIQMSMSKRDGTDPYIHSGRVEDVLGKFCNAYVRDRAPWIQNKLGSFRMVEEQIERILAGAGPRNRPAASVFRELCLVSLDAIRRMKDTRNP